VLFSGGMSDIKSFRDLILWQKSMDLADRCYRRSLRFPREHQMVLGHHIRKSSVSLPSNVAEGFGRHYTAAYINHLWMANGSDYELQTQLELAHRQSLLSEDEATSLITSAEEVTRILKGLVKSLERPTRQ
jgi:four helix bundle protein